MEVHISHPSLAVQCPPRRRCRQPRRFVIPVVDSSPLNAPLCSSQKVTCCVHAIFFQNSRAQIMVIKKTDGMFIMLICPISFSRSCFLNILFSQGTAYVRVHVTSLRLLPDNPDSSHRFASLSSPLLFVGAEPHSSNGPFLPLEVLYFSN